MSSDPAREHVKTARQIETLEARRKESILECDDRAAEETDFQLLSARLRLARIADLLTWREQEQREQQAAPNTLPDSVAGLRQEILKQERRIAELKATPVCDRGAAGDAVIDGLTLHIPFLRQRLAQAEMFEKRLAR
jgi:hypothetical protein